jgi:hypothetical protein
MITNNGKQIIAKFLLGQAPAFATHIAAGSGPKPLETGEASLVSASVQSLDFEVFRVPIIAKGFVKEDNVEKIVFKAEMPTSQRYLISEVGLYPAGANSVAGKYDSKLIVTFSPIEQWSYVATGAASPVLLQPNGAIDSGDNNSNITTTTPAQFVNSDSDIFNNNTRKIRQEPPRLLSKALMVSGSSSYINSSYTIPASAAYLENSTLNFDLSRNSPTDKIKIALSLVSKTFSQNTNPDNVRIVIQFINNVSNIDSERPKATLNIGLTSADFTQDGSANRYLVITRDISELIKDDNFSFANINYIKIFTSVLSSGVPTNNYFVIYDGIRIENISTLNPLYSLVGYNLISTQNALPILKSENTNNYIEYRFGLGVDG